MRSQPRAAAALLLTATLALIGLAVAPSAVALAPAGGCWTYVPDPLDPALSADPVADISTGLEPWTVEDGQVLLGTSGATAAGGTRTVVIGVSSGPVVSALPSVGIASFVLSIDGVPLDAPLTTAFTAEAGQPVRDVVASGSLPVSSAGTHTIRLDSLYFDVPAETTRVACNGQTLGEAGVVNPATEPLPTHLIRDYAAVASPSAEVVGVTGQRVTTAARAGDAVRVRATGLSSSAPATAQLCTATCLDPATEIWVGQDGTAEVTLDVPDSIDASKATIRIADGTTTVQAPLTVLGAPVLAASEKLADDSTVVTLTGSAWDPAKPVVVRGYAATDPTGPTTKDPKVIVDADGSGAFTATFKVTDTTTETIGVTQERGAGGLAAAYSFSGQIGTGGTTDPGTDGGGADPGTDGGTDTGTDGGTDAGTDPGTITDPGIITPVPVEPIPVPDDIPVTETPGEVPTEVPAADAPEDLAVTEVRLDGNATLGEMFGGAVHRDLLFLVENVGDGIVTNPIVRVSVGRSEELQPEIVDVEVGILEPGAQTVVTVPLELPMAAFGTYRVVGQVGDTPLGGFEAEWQTYPWGLFGLNAMAMLLLAWGVRSRLGARRPASFVPGVASTDALIDLAAAERWWTYRAGGVGAVPTAATEEQGAAVVDLQAAEKWWARRGADTPSQVS